MSVLIKDMQMPKNCSECPVALSGKYCRISRTHTTYIKLPMRPEHCPLVELPKHHGDLIDADYLKEHADEWLSVYNLIDSAPTIIEAEWGGELVSVLIRGMKMPENCDVCLFGDWSNIHQTSSCKLREYKAGFPTFSRDYLTKRSKICPLVDCSDYPDEEEC